MELKSILINKINYRIVLKIVLSPSNLDSASRLCIEEPAEVSGVAPIEVQIEIYFIIFGFN